jgi:parvulin-like peptidyl-prolyl isomerase
MWFRFSRAAQAAALLAALVAAAPVAAAAAAVVVDRILAVVDNQLITLSDLQRYRTLFAPEANPEDLVQELIDRALLLHEARRFDIDEPTPDELAAAAAELAKRLGGRDRLAAVRAQLGLAPSDLDRLVAEQLLVRRLVEQRIEFFVFVNPTEVDDVYAAEAESERFAGMAPEEAKRQIEQRLFQAKVREKQRSYLARLRTRSTIQLNPFSAS